MLPRRCPIREPDFYGSALVRAFFWIAFEVCTFGLALLLAVMFLAPFMTTGFACTITPSNGSRWPGIIFPQSSYHSSDDVSCVTVYTFHYIRAQMTTTLSVRIDSDTKDQLEALAKRSRRSKSFLAAEAIAAYVEAERWQLDEIQGGLQQLDKGRAVAHKDVSKWLRSWGKKRERKTPRA